MLALESSRGEGRALESRRPPPAPPADRAAPVGRRRARARPDRLGAHRRQRAGWRSRSPPACAARPATACCAAEEEDPLRAFCGLVSRRTPRAGELAWALRRFELGCERGSAVEALTDWLLAAQALFADVDRAGYDGVAERVAAICAEAHDRARLEARVREAISLERAAMAGFVRPGDEVDALVCELGGCLRAVLRDVLCGHLDPALRRVADDLARRPRRRQEQV